MEKMLSELTSIVPPSATPPDWSLSSGRQGEEEEEGEGEGEESESLDTLAIMRKRLEESVLDEPSENPTAQGEEYSEDPHHKGKGSSSPPIILREGPEGEDGREKEEEEELETAINVLPPTPTTLKEMFGSGGGGEGNVPSPNNLAALTVKGSGVTTITTGGKFSSPSRPLDTSSREVRAASKSDDDLTDQGPFFSPASTRGSSPDLKKVREMCFCP